MIQLIKINRLIDRKHVIKNILRFQHTGIKIKKKARQINLILINQLKTYSFFLKNFALMHNNIKIYD